MSGKYLKIGNKKLYAFFRVVVFLFAAQSVFAIEFVQKEEFVRKKTEPITEELWVSAQRVFIQSEVSDDLFVVGKVIDLDGTFFGDVWAVGNQIVAAGHYHDPVRLISQRSIQLSGIFNGTLAAMGYTIKVEPSATIKEDIFCIGKNIISEGHIEGDVQVVAKNATLGGDIKGDVSIIAEDIVILPGTVIGGNMNYTAPKEILLSPSIILHGDLTRTIEPPVPLRIVHSNLIIHFAFAMAALLTGLVFGSLFPHYTGRAVQLLQNTQGRCILTGFVALFLIPISAFFLFITLIGLPLSILIFLFYFISLYLSKIIVGFWLGLMILRHKGIERRNGLLTLALGLLIIYALTAITIIGMAIHTLIAILGLGAMILALFKKPTSIDQTSKPIQSIKMEK